MRVTEIVTERWDSLQSDGVASLFNTHTTLIFHIQLHLECADTTHNSNMVLYKVMVLLSRVVCIRYATVAGAVTLEAEIDAVMQCKVGCYMGNGILEKSGK